MFRGIDKQCRIVATCACLLCSIVSIVAGGVVIGLGAAYQYPALQFAGVLYMVMGPFISYMGVYVSYVFSALMGLVRA